MLIAGNPTPALPPPVPFFLYNNVTMLHGRWLAVDSSAGTPKARYPDTAEVFCMHLSLRLLAALSNAEDLWATAAWTQYTCSPLCGVAVPGDV